LPSPIFATGGFPPLTSALIAAGVDVVRVSTVLGHAKVSTTLDTYAAQFNARGAHDMGDVIGAAFGGVGG
jgi:hypothetical protein